MKVKHMKLKDIKSDRAKSEYVKSDHVKSKYYKIWRFLFFPSCFIYLELVFHLAVYGSIGSVMLHPVLFGLAAGMTAAVVTVLLPRIGNAVAAYFLTAVFCVYYIVQLIYYRIFDTFLSLISVGGAENAMNFKVVLFEKLRANLGWMLALLMPLVFLVVLHVVCVSFQPCGRRRSLVGAALCVLAWMLAVLGLPLHGKAAYSPYDLFHGHYVFELSMEKLGVLVTTVRDGIVLVSGNKGNEAQFVFAETQEPVPDWVDYAVGTAEYGLPGDGIRHVDFGLQVDASINLEALYRSTEDETLRNLTAYMSGRQPTSKNNYTGLFAGYNLVFVTAESLSPYGISAEWTPTLYKIMNQGLVFDNFYNPRWYHSTIDGEYVNCLGQYPCSSEWSFYKSADTYQPYALGNALRVRGYTCKAYHDYTFYYYNRSETHANMGYDFKAIDYGLEIPYYTPYSDLDTMQAVCGEFIHDEPFVMYFMSFSGHLPYNYGYNAMSLKNREEAERVTAGMHLPEEAVAYIAAQMELDQALEYLMEELDKSGALAHTLFVVTPDHYPYGLSKSTYNTLAGREIADDRFELHRSCLGIWSAAMEEGGLQLCDGSSVTAPVHVDKLCASVDILPTILNLLGVAYDSRLLAGNDIMAESEELVIFADHSFITDKVRYNTATGEVSYLVNEAYVPDAYITSMAEKVENILYISDKLIDADYFSFVYGK